MGTIEAQYQAFMGTDRQAPRSEWERYGVRGQARIGKLARDVEDLKDRDLNDSARGREYQRLRVEALEDLTIMADSAINHLRQEIAQREDRYRSAIAREDRKLDYSRLSFHAERLRGLVAAARDLGAIEAEIRRLSQTGLPEEKRAAAAVVPAAIMDRFGGSGMQSLMEARQLAGQVPEMVPEDDTVRAQREAVEEMVDHGLALKEAIRGWYKQLTGSIEAPSGPLGAQYQRIGIAYPTSANNWGQGLRVDADVAVTQEGQGWPGGNVQYNGSGVSAE